MTRRFLSVCSTAYLQVVAQALGPCATLRTKRAGKEAMMNVGISLFPGQHPVDVAVVAQKAEALGFDSLWLGEHPVIPVHTTAAAPGTSGGSRSEEHTSELQSRF